MLVDSQVHSYVARPGPMLTPGYEQLVYIYIFHSSTLHRLAS